MMGWIGPWVQQKCEAARRKGWREAAQWYYEAGISGVPAPVDSEAVFKHLVQTVVETHNTNLRTRAFTEGFNTGCETGSDG